MDKRRVFVAVVEHGSYTAAADRLGISLSYASRRVRALEEELGVSLLARTTRKVRPTPEGARYHARLAPLLAALDELDQETAHQPVEPTGTLRVALPHAFGMVAIAPLLAEFQLQWPAVEVEASFSDRVVDPLDWDVTVRGGGRLADSSLVARRLVGFRGVLAASPAYLDARGTPRTLDEVAAHDAVRYTATRSLTPWAFGDTEVHPRFRYRADSGDALITAAAAGLGLVYQPDFLVRPALEDGRLVQLLPDVPTFEGGFWAIRGARNQTRTVTAFVEHLATGLARCP